MPFPLCACAYDTMKVCMSLIAHSQFFSLEILHSFYHSHKINRKDLLEKKTQFRNHMQAARLHEMCYFSIFLFLELEHSPFSFYLILDSII